MSSNTIKMSGAALFLFLALGIVVCRPVFFINAASQLIEGASQLTACVEMPLSTEEHSAPSLVFIEQRTLPISGSMATFQRISCATVRAATSTSSENIAWLNGLRFVIVDDTNGVDGQASHMTPAFRRTRIEVSSSAMDSAPTDTLYFTLAHELGHGVLMHAEKKLLIQMVGLLLVIGGIVGMAACESIVLNPIRRRHRTASLCFLLTLSGAILVGKGGALLSVDHELEADAYAVNVLKKLGYSMNQAQQVTACALSAHINATEESWLMHQNPHPATTHRLSAMQNEVFRDVSDPSTFCKSLPPIKRLF